MIFPKRKQKKIELVARPGDNQGTSGQLNNGVKSLVDGRQLDETTSDRIEPQAGRDIASKHHALRWTEVFLIPNR